MLLLGVVFVFGAISLLVLGMLWREPSTIAARMAAIRGESFAGDYRPVEQEPATSRIVGPLADVIGKRLEALLPASIVNAVDRSLLQAGAPITREGFLFAAAMVGGGMIMLGLMTSDSMGGLQGKGLAVFAGCAILGLMMPKVWLDNRVRARQHEILKSLPDAFDLVTTCVEAGLGLDAALAKVSEKLEGPFAEELAVSLREVSMGKLRRDSLKELGERIGIPDLTIFINAVIQAEMMGTSIATVLRVQADQMRTRRRQRAEAQAYKAPVKMIFPLVLCIFPTLFVVILGPAVISIYETLVKK